MSTRGEDRLATIVAHQGTSFKVAAPDLFHGDRKKLREFISQIQLNFMFNPKAVNTASKKIIYAAIYLQGPVYDWFELYLMDQTENEDSYRPATAELFESFNNFKKKLEQVYGDADTVKEAERGLQRLRQTGAASKYASEFHQLSSRVHWGDSVLAAVFYTGLKDSVKDELWRIDRPDELQPLMDLAIKIDTRLYERQLEKGQGRNVPFIHRNKANSGKKRYSKPDLCPREMDLSANTGGGRKGPPRKKGLSKDKREEYARKNLCFNCGKPGHRAAECRGGKPRFNVSNQRQPAGIAEDSVNKPWRPLPALRLSHVQAKRLNWALYPVVVLTTLVVGGTRASICLMILGYLYNETGAGDVFYTRNFLNAAGYLSFVFGAVEVVTSFHDGTFSMAGQQWFALIFAVIASTGHMQDIPDQAGDEARGRRTLPLAIGDWNACISIAILVPAWSLVAVAFWGTGFLGSIATASLRGMLACRVVSGNTSYQNGDKISFFIWNAWVVSLYLLPISQ